MIRNEWLCPLKSAASATFVFLFSSACLVTGVGAQTTAPIMAGLSVKQSAPSTFLVAPSFPLGYSPSSVATGDLRRSGKLDLVTADYNSGKITVFLGAGKGNFAAGAAYYSGPHPSSIAVADINGDGRPDVLVCNDTEGTLSVLLGAGDGTFQPLQSYAIGFNPSFVATGDFNGNGEVDVAVAGASGYQLAVLLSDGYGSLQKPILYPLSKTPTALLAAKFGSGGPSGLALANADGTVSILLGKGAGHFRALPDIGIASGALSSIVAADFNKDGKVDLVVTQPGQKLVSVLIGQGGGVFAPAVSNPVGNVPVSTLAADVDGDGIADLIVVNKSSNTFSVLGGNGNGTFKNSIDYVAGNAPLAAVAGDFYGNGHVDLAIINHLSGTVNVPRGYGDGTFMAGRSYASGLKPVSIVSGNLNGDKTPGLVVANYCGSDSSCGNGGNVSVFLADSKGTYRLSSTYNVGAGPVAVSLADVNGDGILDIIALNRLGKTVSVLPGVGNGTFGQQVTFAVVNAPTAIAVGDFNKDGQPDLAVLGDCGSAKCSQPGSVEILLGAGAGNFQNVLSYPVGYSPVSIVIGDIKGDKNLGLIVANRCGNDASCLSPGTGTVLFGDGKGKFTSGPDVALGKSPSAIALGNLSALGFPDLVVSQSANNSVSVLRSKGDGTFQPPVPYSVGAAPGSLVVADFNGDEIPDVAVTNSNDSTVSVLFGRGDGTLQAATALPVGSGPFALTAIGNTVGGRASLATANGNGTSSAMGMDITVLANVQPFAGSTASTTTLTVTPSTTTVNPGSPVTLNVTVTGGSGTPTGTVDITGNGIPTTVCAGLVLSGAGTASCTTSALQADTTTLTATYSGDPVTYAVGTGTAPVTVNKLSPTVSLTSSPANSSAVNAPVTFTATLSGVSFNPTIPAGTVAFSAGGTLIVGCSAVAVSTSQQAACTTSSLRAVSNPIVATYSGDTNFNSATSATLPHTITALPGTLTITATPGPSVAAGTSVTFTAQLAAAALTPVTPSGTVTFTINGAASTDCPPKTVTAGGAATCTTSSLLVPADVITATYSGDLNFTVATPATFTETVGKTAALTALLSSLPTASVNQQVTFTATVTAPSGSVRPTGSVNFTQGATVLCSAVAISNTTGVATCVHAFTSAIASPGSTITATYSGDANFSPGTPGTVSEIVTATATSTAIVAAPSPAYVNQTVTFTATVTPTVTGSTNPTGTVTFTYTLGAGGPVNLCSSPVAVSTAAGVTTAVCTTALHTAGAYTISAAYATGDSNFASSTGQSTLNVNAVPTTTTVTSSPVNSSVNQPVTFTAIVTSTFAGATAPTGVVAFSYSLNGGSSVVLCPSVAVSTGAGITTATCAAPLPTAGNYVITAAYAPADQNFAASSGTTPHSVGLTGTTTTVSGSLANPSVNQPVIFTATVTPGTTGSTNPTGTVTFSYTSATVITPVNLCAPKAVSTTAGVTTAVCSGSLPSTGSFIVTALYAGDQNFGTSSGTTPLTVGTTGTRVSLTSSSSPSVVNQPVSFTAVISPDVAGTTLPTGRVTFTDTTAGVPLCSSLPVLNDGTVASCSATFLTAGTHAIAASFLTGDNNFLSSTSPGFQQIVSPEPTAIDLSSSSPVSVAANPLTFTATVRPTPFIGAALPQGTVTFTSSDGTLNALCGARPLAATVNGTAIAICTAPFPLTIPLSASSQIVSAVYISSDGNFANSTSTIPQTVKNFSVTFSPAAPGPVLLTQGASTATATVAGTDPFNPTTIKVTVASSAGFNDSLNLTCAVTPDASIPAPIILPTCTLSATTLVGTDGSVLTYTVRAAANASVGSYAVSLTAADGIVGLLTHATTPLKVFVVGSASTLNFAQGASGSENVIFDTSTPITGTPATNLNKFACGSIFNRSTNSTILSSQVTCNGVSSAVTGAQTSVLITISTSSATVAGMQRSSSIYAAAFLGIPLIALVGWFGSRKSPRKNFFRFIGLILLFVGLSYATGCGGSFHATSTPVTGLDPGSYFVQVIATDSANGAQSAQYYAVVPLVVIATK